VLRLDEKDIEDITDDRDDDLIEFMGKDSHISRIESAEHHEESKATDRSQHYINKLITEIGLITKQPSEELKRKAGREAWVV
jgi:hypothetical protein